MPNPDDDLEARLAVLEPRLREQAAVTSSEATAARVDAAAARVLAAGADHDVSEVRAELRAHLQALNALRETQLAWLRSPRRTPGKRVDSTGWVMSPMALAHSLAR